MNIANTTITNSNTNNVLVTNSTGISSYSSGPINISYTITEDLIKYIDLLYQILEIDIDYDRFKNMSHSERICLIRDIKIKKLIG